MQLLFFILAIGFYVVAAVIFFQKRATADGFIAVGSMALTVLIALLMGVF